MLEQTGIFLVLEGADGSGKGTQFNLLAERLKAVGYDVEIFDFPRYDEPSSHFVRKYLNGEYGDAASISPYTASLFFALDRYEAAPKIKKALAGGKIVLSNRYVGSNMAHQGGKFTNSGEQRGFFIWEDGLEFQLLGIPRPTMNIFLRVPAEVSYELIGKKAKRSYTEKSHDQHEGDLNHLTKSVATYDTLCKLFPKDYKAIECAPDGKLMSIADINDKIWEVIKPVLPQKPPHAGREVVFRLGAQEEKNKEEQNAPQAVASENSVFKNQENGDLQITIKKVSLLAASYVRRTPGISCEIASPQWPADGSYNFYTPADLPKELVGPYKKTLDKLSALHKQIREELSKHCKSEKLQSTLYDLTPLAALATINISADESSIANLISRLRSNSLTEVKWLAEQIQAAANQLRPGKFPAEKPKDLLSGLSDPLSQIAIKNLGRSASSNTEKISLQGYWPKNEFALLVDALYPYSTSSHTEIATELESWSYEQKKEALTAALHSGSSPILEEARYRWDICAPDSVLNELKQSLSVQELFAQPHTPKYGFDVPEEIAATALDEIYIECYSVSQQLFKILEGESQENNLAEYAVLAGHKKRWQFVTSAKSLISAMPQAVPKDADEILIIMREKVGEHHALIGRHINSPDTKPAQTKEKTPAKEAEKPKKPALQRRRRSRRPKK
jgi:dTMP kinase